MQIDIVDALLMEVEDDELICKSLNSDTVPICRCVGSLVLVRLKNSVPQTGPMWGCPIRL